MAYVVPEQADEFKDQVENIVDNALLQEEMMTSLAENLIQKGQTERQYNVARRMLRKGYSIEEIVEITELPHEEVERLSLESQDSSD